MKFLLLNLILLGSINTFAQSDECATATNLTVSNTCSFTSGTISGATASSQPNGCSGFANNDVWYRFTAPASGGIEIQIANVALNPADLYHSVYEDNCGALGAAVICSDPNTSFTSTLTPGNSYLIRVYSFSIVTGNTTFDICVKELGPCGTPENQDYCAYPAILTEGGANFSSTTSDVYSTDTPANFNSSLFCGTIENNSWYSFIASGPTATFEFSQIYNCNITALGIQAEVFQVTEDANGCCTNLTSVSNCLPNATTVPSYVNATGLTAGQEYILVVDGFAGAVCDFTITGWSATGLLPVELQEFGVVKKDNVNKINWITASERNNDYFLIQKSDDAINFETIAQKNGNGNSSSLIKYSVLDESIKPGIVYYRLKQFDFNGEYEYSKIVSVKRDANSNEISAVSPNPATNVLTIEYNSLEAGTIEILTPTGSKVSSYPAQSGNNQLTINLKELNSGMYLITLSNEYGTVSTHKIIKQ